MRLPGTFLNQSSDTKIKVKIGQNLKIKSTVKGLREVCSREVTLERFLCSREVTLERLLKGGYTGTVSLLKGGYTGTVSLLKGGLLKGGYTETVSLRGDYT